MMLICLVYPERYMHEYTIDAMHCASIDIVLISEANKHYTFSS